MTEIFVFGSNLGGNHAGGAAKFAADNHGAESGVGEGPTGNAYALPTMTEDFQPRSLDDIAESVKTLLAFAAGNPEQRFKITRVGCGIAGFIDEQIAPMFAGAPDNCVFDPEWSSFGLTSWNSMKGYKAFNDKWQCTPDGKVFQYEVGKTYEHPGNVELCGSGFHFCENPLNLFGFYPPTGKFAEVIADGVVNETDESTKRAAKRLKIHAEVSLSHIIGIGVKFILDKVDFKNAKESNTGYRSAATNTGSQSAATNTGSRSAATNTGYQSAATNTGSQSAATNTGYQSAATNTGYQSAATNTGDWSAATNTGSQSAATNTGDWSAATNTGYQSAATNTGKEGCAISLGIEGKASGAIGCWLTLAEWKQDENYEWHRIDVQTVKVDGEVIKADTFYMLKRGKFVEA